MRVLLLSPPFLPYYMRNARCDFVSLSGTQWYPLLLGYCGVWLEKCGHTVKMIDAPACHLNSSEITRLTENYRPDWLVVYTGRLSEDSDVGLADDLATRLQCSAVLVGPYASISPRKILEKCSTVRFLVRGEFEKPVQELIEGKPHAEIKNLLYRRGSEIQENDERPYLATADLDEFPFVSAFFKKHLDIRRYRTVSEPYPFMDILTGRGCQWGRCTYCLWVHTFVKGPVYNVRSNENLIEEFRFISKEMPEVESVMLQDDTFPEERAHAFSEAKNKAGISLPWSCYARGSISYDTLVLMKRANCLNLHVGFESADPSILKKIRKGLSRDTMSRFAKDAKKAGLRIHGDFGIGFPGETMQTALETIRWACSMRPHTAQFQLMIPFPGTPFYEQLREAGWLNAKGFPDYPELSARQMESLSKFAYRKFYISLPHLAELARHPYDLLLSRVKTYYRAVPSVLWKKYER